MAQPKARPEAPAPENEDVEQDDTQHGRSNTPSEGSEPEQR